jgi:hypothetical protein
MQMHPLEMRGSLRVALELSKATWVVALRVCEFLPVAVTAAI